MTPRARRSVAGGAEWRRVVVAVDFSAGSRAAMRRLARLPLGAAPTLHLVHAIAVPTLTPLRVAKQLAREQLERVAAGARKRWPRARLRLWTPAGRPADEIVRIAREESAELIVAGRRGAGGFPRLLLGSTAERLARLSPVPLLIVGYRTRAYRHVFFALDVAEDTSEITRAAQPLLSAGTQVDLAHAYWAYGEGYLRFGGRPPRAVHQHRLNVREQARAGLTRAAAAIARPDANIILVNGDPRSDVPALLHRREADVVIVGNHAHNAIARALLGSVAHELVTRAECDVLLVPTGAPSRAPRHAGRS